MDHVSKEPCPACREAGKDRSGDNLVVYPEDRGAHCFACGYHVHGAEGREGGERKVSAKLDRPLNGQYAPLASRKIDEKTCRIEIVSDVLLQHHTVQTRRWLNALIPRLK